MRTVTMASGTRATWATRRRGPVALHAVMSCLVVVFGGLLAAHPAAAADRNEAIDFDPPAGSNVQLEPSRVTIAFDQSIPRNDATIVVKNEAGNDVTNGVFTIEANNIYAQLPYPVEPGIYTVHYRVSDTNGTPFGGSFQFAWDAPGAEPAGHESWRGPENIPPVVALEGDPPNGGAGAEPSPEPSPTPTDADGGVSTTDPDSDADSDANSAQEDETQSGGASPWWWIVLALVAAGIALLMWWLPRRASLQKTPTQRGSE